MSDMTSNLANVESTPGVLVVPGIAGLQQAAFPTEEYAGVAGTMQGFLPYLKLFTSNSDEVKRGDIPLTHYGLIVGKDKLKDYGKNPVVVLLAWRPKAMDLTGDKPVSFFNQKSPEFQKVKATANSGMKNNKCIYGPEYLIWVDGQYATFFLSSKTARNAAPSFNALLPTADGRLNVGVLGNQFIETDEFSWHGPTITVSSQSVRMPELETIAPTISVFLKPQDSVIEQTAPANAQEEVTR